MTPRPALFWRVAIGNAAVLAAACIITALIFSPREHNVAAREDRQLAHGDVGGPRREDQGSDGAGRGEYRGIADRDPPEQRGSQRATGRHPFSLEQVPTGTPTTSVLEGVWPRARRQ